MEKKNLTEVESLELITSMINDSRSRLARNSGTPFLIWGYTTIAVSLFNALAIYLGWSYSWGWSWFAIPVVGWVGMLLLGKSEPSARNYIDRVISIIWATLGVSFAWFFLAAIVYGCSIAYLTILVMGAGTVITGLTLKDRATTICGGAAMIVSLICKNHSFPNSFLQVLLRAVMTPSRQQPLSSWKALTAAVNLGPA